MMSKTMLSKSLYGLLILFNDIRRQEMQHGQCIANKAKLTNGKMLYLYGDVQIDSLTG